MSTLLTHVNNTLALIGEQPLSDTTGNLGTLAKRCLQSALYTLVAETRHTSFLSQTTFTVTNTDHTLPAFTLPALCIQLKSIYWRSDAPAPYRVIKLYPASYDTLDRNWSYCIVGSQVFVGYSMPRPFTAVLEAYVAPSLEGAVDSFAVVIPQETEIALEATAAALLGSSYLDDLAAQGSLQRRAEAEIAQLRKRAGAMRAPISWR
jgi:hypothetical protein